MGAYLARIDSTPESDRWKLVRGLIFKEPLAFFEELREERHVLVLPEVTIATRFVDCSLILRRHESFGVDLYKPKQGEYFMAQDDTAAHWREKSVMRAILDREDIPAIRAWVRDKTKEALAAGNGNLDFVRAITRGIPITLVQEWFGFSSSDPDKLIEWSYWNQQDAFWNQPFDSVARTDQSDVVRKREAANIAMALYLAKLVARRKLALFFWSSAQDPVTRLLRLASSKALKFSIKDAAVNAGGLLIGAVETTSHASVNAVQFLLDDPARRESAIAAARADDDRDFDGFVFEALRFRPAFPYFFRVCHKDTPLAVGSGHETLVKPGTTVLALTHSAMFDDVAFQEPAEFNHARDLSDTFTFGQGLHQCLGIAIARVMIPEIVRQILCLNRLSFSAPPDFAGGSVPERWVGTYGLP